MTDRLSRRLDGLGWLELIGTSIGFGAVLALQIVQLVSTARDETTPGPTARAIGVVAAAVIAGVTMTLVARQWQRHGGRQVQRLGRTVWLTGRLPDTLPERVAVLRDLERREQQLERSWLPAWVGAVVWSLLVVAHLSSRPGPVEAVTGVALLVFFLAVGVTDLLDRRMQPRLRRLASELRHDPVPAAPTAL